MSIPPGDVGIRHDEYDPRIVWCLGKRIYLGEDTQISRLFWLLAKPIGRVHTLWDVQRAIDVGETRRDTDDTGEEFRKACQRVRRAMARLRRAIRDADADTHLLIVAGGDRANPEYTMVLRFGTGG